MADGVRVPAALGAGRHVGAGACHPAGASAPRRRAGAHAQRRDPGQPERQDGPGGPRGFDGGKQVTGRKRHLLVDSQGWVWGLVVTPANVQDKAGARLLAAQVAPLAPRLTHLWADGGFGGAALAQELAASGWTLEVVRPAGAARGFAVLPKRWIVERTFGWCVQQRRLRLDYEELPEVSATFVYLAMIGLMARRLVHASTS